MGHKLIQIRQIARMIEHDVRGGVWDEYTYDGRRMTFRLKDFHEIVGLYSSSYMPPFVTGYFVGRAVVDVIEETNTWGKIVLVVFLSDDEDIDTAFLSAVYS